MIKQVHSDPENVYVASGYKEIGSSIEINRERITNVIASYTRESSEAAIRRMQEYADDYMITDSEKDSLKIELSALERDYENILTDTKNADFGDTEEFRAVRDAYNKIHDLLYKIVSYVGTYKGSDVQDIVPLYQDYTDKASYLESLILDATAERERIGSYYSMTRAGVDIYPESVAVSTSTTITASLIYNGEEKISLVPVDAISYGITGLSSSVTSAMFTLPQGAEITVTPITNSAVVTKCRSFQMSYDAIGSNGAKVNISITLDSGSMPF